MVKDGDDEVFGGFISVSSLCIILRAHFMIFTLCLKTRGILLFVRAVCFFIHTFTLIAISLHLLDNRFF